MNRSKKKAFPIEDKPSEIKYDFSNLFNVQFEALIKAYSDALDSLSKMGSGKVDCDYGVCSTTYHTRYITPKNISSFVDNLLRVIEGGFFHDNMNDVNMFIVASVRKFFEENGCETLDDDVARSNAHDNVNPKEWTLNDLESICTNDSGMVAVYSKGEIIQRIKLAAQDINTMKNMHFAANAKKLVKAMPKIINDSCVYSMAIMKAIFKAIEDFLLFAVTVNTCTVLQMYAYCNPTSDYSVKKVKKDDDDKEDVVTECCICKTNDFMIRNRMPFNCNMRDVVLQDVTPNFRDTHDALHFIMKDARSPICILVQKYAPKDAGRNFHGGDAIARMFLGVNRCHEHCLNDVFKKDGERECADPLSVVAGFQTKVDWLDTIAFGNNYLDGNYRRDAVGNNHVHPITNSLDMIFKMYSGIDLTTNEEIAENIICVAGAIKGIIHAYNEGTPIENYDLTKDVLTLLGEILTRNMLRLYYNNTQVVSYTDDMFNAAAPGFIEESFMMEGFVMEATDGTGSDTGDKKKEGNYGGMKYTDANGNEIKPTNVGKLKALLNSIIKWFKEKFLDWTKSSAEKMMKYVNEVEKNDKNGINEEIKNDIGRSFNVTHPKYHLFNIDLKKFEADAPTSEIEKCIVSGENYDPTKMAVHMLGIPMDIVNNNIVTTENHSGKGKDGKEPDWKDITTKCVIYYFYKGFSDGERFYNGPIDGEKWQDMINDVKGSVETINKVSTAFDKKSKAVNDIIQRTIDGNADEQRKARAEAMTKVYTDAYTVLSKNITVALATTWVKDRYNTYIDILTKYKGQRGSGNANNTNTNTNTETEVNAEVSSETPAETTEGGTK